MPTGLFNLKQVNQAISQGAWSGYIAPKWVEYLVVAGGGGGAGSYTNGIGPGGGAGGLLTGIVTVAAGTSYTVTVGAGGTAGSASSTSAQTNGVNSVFGSISATGGGYGAANLAPSSGGSGGGGAAIASATAGASGVAGQGNSGGTATLTANYGCGGGGGAGTKGLDGTTSSSGNGGAGIASSITGVVTTYAGGGGASGFTSLTAGTGGVGGGGAGSFGTAGTSGSSNTGGGGGGAGYSGGHFAGGAGGSGIVVVRYPGSVQFFTGGTLSYANGYMIHTFYASGTLAPTTPTPYVTDYQISRSLRFNQPDSTYLARTPASAGSRTTWTLSGWFKGFKSNLNNVIYVAGSGANQTGIYVDSANQQLNFYEIQSSSYIGNLITTQVFRDISAWYHIVAVYDSTQATASSRMRLYVNGTQVTAFGTATYVPQNTNSIANSAVITEFGNGSGNAAFYEGLMTELNFIDGQALTPSSFGYTDPDTGVWSPLAFVGTYGTNGFYLNFSDNSNTTAATLGKDYSGNGNNWTPNNFSVTAGAGNDSLVDSPTSYGTDTGVGGTVRGNYCTFNPLFKLGGTTALTWALNGNLQAKSDSNASMVVYGTMGLDPSTKFYNEFTMTNTVEGADHVGIVTDIQAVADGGTCVAYRADGQKIVNGTVSSYGASYTDNDVIGIAVNLVDNQVTFYKNGTSQGAITGVTSVTYFHRVRFNNVAGQQTEVYGNWGQRAFANTAPSGFKALCTQNLPTPTIGATSATQAGKYYNAVLYTGNGTARSITGVGFQPDWVWYKLRDTNSNSGLFDAVRGATKRLISNTTDAEDTTSGVTSFDSDGFSLGTGAGNTSGFTFVAWNWKANGSGSTNTAGSITSTVSANTTSGFSVVTWTGNATDNASVGHGLGVAPKMVIIKNRSTSAGWPVYTNVIDGSMDALYLNLTDAKVDTGRNQFTSSVFYVSSGTDTNGSGNSLVAYCFAEVAGYSKFGSYTGNGSTDGPFVFTGMRPAYVMVKRTDTGGVNMNWIIWDATRNTTNVVGEELYANLSDAGTTYTDLDLLSNGIKIRSSTTWYNASGGTYFYMAFASNPFKYSLAR